MLWREARLGARLEAHSHPLELERVHCIALTVSRSGRIYVDGRPSARPVRAVDRCSLDPAE